MTEFANRDPATPRFWDERFERNFTPWDRGGVPQALRDFVDASPMPMVTLIPGCGAAYELAYLAEQGWDAVAIDFSPAAVAKAKAGLGQWAANVVLADFFSYVPASQPDLVYERAFLCALPSAMWPRVAARWADLLAPGGLLAGFFFFDDGEKGPPFGVKREALDKLLSPFFECVENAAVDDSIAVFKDKERWMVWRRR